MTKPEPIIVGFRYQCGDVVRVGGTIKGVVEQIIISRQMVTPLYLVEWWHDGMVTSRQFHEHELSLWEGGR